MNEPRIKIETFPNLLGRGYHTTCELSNTCILSLERPFKPKVHVKRKRFSLFRKKQTLFYDDMKILEAGTRCIEMCKVLFAIEGIDHVCIKPYEASVYIGQAFRWCDVEPQVLEALKQQFDNPNDVSVISPFDRPK